MLADTAVGEVQHGLGIAVAIVELNAELGEAQMLSDRPSAVLGIAVQNVELMGIGQTDIGAAQAWVDLDGAFEERARRGYVRLR